MMRPLAPSIAALLLFGLMSAQAPEQGIVVTRNRSQPSRQGPAEYFTGSARIDPLFGANPPARTTGARVTFEPGARTVWAKH